MSDNTHIATSKAKPHQEGWAIHVLRGETKLATVYGATKDEAQMRASIAATAFKVTGVY